MSKQSDMQDLNITQDIWVTDVAYSDSETFDSAPLCFTMAQIVKKKSGVYPGTEGVSDRDLTCEEDDLFAFSIEAGADAGSASTHPELDSGEHNQSVAKVLESVSFNRTFTSVPIVITSYKGVAAKGKKHSSGNRTTTGCDVTLEAAEYVNWFATVSGFFNPS